MKSYIKRVADQAVGKPFTLPKNYIKDNGDVVTNVSNLSPEELSAIGLFEVIETESFNDVIHLPDGWTYAFDAVSATVTYPKKTLEQLQSDKIEKVYYLAKQLLDKEIIGRSLVEIATWPLLKEDIRQYNVNQNIGPYMQKALDTSQYDAQGLSAYLTPKINFESDVLTVRKTHTQAILSKVNKDDILAYVIEAGWPI